MKKAFMLAIFCIAIVGFWLYKKPKTNFAAVLPNVSEFFIDHDFSKNFSTDIQSSIQDAYRLSKNPQEVIDQITKSFNEIACMKVQICQSDKICFYVDASDPVFLLNQEFVVCQNGAKVCKDHFSSKIIQSLVQVSSSKDSDAKEFGSPIDVGNNNCLQQIIDFVTALPEKFRQEFLIVWLDKNDIVLQPKNDKDCILQVSVDMIPSLQDLQDCQKIVQTLALKTKNKKKRMVCDVRFKNQIIVR